MLYEKMVVIIMKGRDNYLIVFAGQHEHKLHCGRVSHFIVACERFHDTVAQTDLCVSCSGGRPSGKAVRKALITSRVGSFNTCGDTGPCRH